MKKIPTLFKREFNGHKIINVLNELTDDELEEALLDGEATVKWDGSCCAVINGELYKRYDAKKGKPIPDGAIKCQDDADEITGHLPCWLKCDRDNPSDKWFWSAYDATDNIKDGTYEALGKHFNGNPYNLEYDFLKPHGTDVINGLDRTFESIKEYLEIHNIEGIVFWLNGEPKCKIKRSDFGFEWNKKH